MLWILLGFGSSIEAVIRFDMCRRASMRGGRNSCHRSSCFAGSIQNRVNSQDRVDVGRARRGTARQETREANCRRYRRNASSR